jgi:hypothetical protein
MRSSIAALVFMIALAGYASASDDFQSTTGYGMPSADNSLLIILSAHERQRATEAMTHVLNDPTSARFSSVYGVINRYADTGYVVCGSVAAKNLTGDAVVQRYFAFSEGRKKIIDEASNWGLGFNPPSQQISLKHKARSFVGSWWTQCRPQSFTKLVQRHQGQQREMQAARQGLQRELQAAR